MEGITPLYREGELSEEDIKDLENQVDIFLKYAKEKNANRERSERELREPHPKEMQRTRDKPT